MGPRYTLPLFALLLAFSADGAFAQQTADIDGVKAASKAFYEAVVVVDDGTAMEKVWAQTPYVTYVGPRSTAIILGWEAQKKYWTEFKGTPKLFIGMAKAQEIWGNRFGNLTAIRFPIPGLEASKVSGNDRPHPGPLPQEREKRSQRLDQAMRPAARTQSARGLAHSKT